MLKLKFQPAVFVSVFNCRYAFKIRFPASGTDAPVQFFSKVQFQKTDSRYMDMGTNGKTGLSKIQQYVMHLRYILARHQMDEVDPPEWFLNEIKIAERLAQIELKEREKFRQKLEI